VEKILHILILEDVPTDAELIERELRRAEIDFVARRVATREAFLQTLQDFSPDLILADYSLPSFDGISALSMAREKCPEVPFVFVSGAIGEELAIETLKQGATDYVLKQRLSRLAPSVGRALREAGERAARKSAEEALRKAHDELEQKVKERTAALAKANAVLCESEERLARILESVMDAIIIIDQNRRITLFNLAAEKIYRCPAAEAIGEPFDRFFGEQFRQLLAAYMQEEEGSHEATRSLWAPEGLAACRADGEEFSIEATISRVEISGQKLYAIILRDINDRKQAEAELRKLQLENVYLQEEIKTQYNFGEIVGASAAIKKVFQRIEQVAATDSTVLLLGETGTGKELVARAVHRMSRRKDRVLIKVNCAALPAGLIESELFGHEKGAFTGALARKIGRFELANGGTIFLDEIGDLPLDLQTKLLRILQEGEFERVGGTQTLKADIRVIAATNRDLEKAIAEAKFRSDLFYRLHVFPIHIPPLRERKEDIPLLVGYFARRYGSKFGKKIETIPQKTMYSLQAYPWPGNVRELENVIERAVIINRGAQLALGDWIPRPHIATNGKRLLTIEELERNHILEMLELTGWRVSGETGAAKVLGLKPTTLEARMKKLGIKRKGLSSEAVAGP
jgi:PAS domain S-box-containing protein